MVNDPTWLERALAWLLFPPTIWGAVGGFGSAYRANKGWRESVARIVGGVAISNMVGPVVAAYVPFEWQPTCYGAIGFGGWEFAGHMYEVVAQALEKKLKHKMGGGD